MADKDTLIIFGNGYQAILKESYPSTIDKEGIARTKLVLWIGTETENHYKLQLPNERVIEREYPTQKIRMLNASPMFPVMFIFCGFNGEPTDFETMTYADLLELIESKEKLIQTMREDNHYLHDMLKMATSRQIQYAKYQKMLEEERKVPPPDTLSDAEEVR